MATADVILSINSRLGPGGMASLQSGIQMIGRLGRKVIESVKELEKFSQVYRRVEIDILAADRATKGLIDTTELFRGTNKFIQAEMKITAEQYKHVALVAADHAKKMGTNATDEFNALVKSITLGQERALKKLGIDLQGSSEDLVAMQTEAMEKITAKAHGLTVEIETLGEELFVLNNNLDTSMGLMFDWASELDRGDGFLSHFNDSLAWFNEQMMETNGGLMDTITSGEGFGLMMQGMALDLVHSIGLFGDWSEEIDHNAQLFNDLEQAISDTARAQKELNNLVKIRQGITADADAAAADAAAIAAMNAAVAAGTYKAPVGAKKKRRGGGGGGGRKKKRADEIDFLTDRAFTAREQVDGGFGPDNIYDTPEVSDALLGLAPSQEELDRMAQENEHKAELLNLQMQLFDARSEQMENESNMAHEFRAAWVTAYEDVSAASLLASQSTNALRQATMASTQAAIYGGESIGRAATKALSAVAAQVAGESVFQALRETAAGFGAWARKDYEAMGNHFTSAAGWTATGIAAGSAAYGLNQAAGGRGEASSGGGLNPSGSGFVGGMPGGPPAGGSGTGQQPVNITVTLEGGIEGWIEAAVEENDKRERHGQRTF